MIPHDQLAAFLDDALDAGPRNAIENELAREPEALQFVVEQRKIDRALRSLFGKAAHKQRLRESILSAVAGTSFEQLRAQVMADTSARETAPAVATPTRSAGRPAGNNELHAGQWNRPWRSFRQWAATTLQRFELSLYPRLAAAAALIAVGIGICFYYVGRRPVARIEVGQFATVVGTPTVRPVGQRSTLNAQRSTPICLGDGIETGDADRAEIQFRDGTTLRLHFNTVLEIPIPNSEDSNRQLAIGNQSSTTSRSNTSTLQRPPEVNLLRGQVWTKVEKTTNAPRYAVRTPLATAVAKGTEFGLKLQKTVTTTNNNVRLSTLNSQPSTLVAVLTVKQGAVEFFNSFGSVQATAMTESTARADARPTEPKRLQTLQVMQTADSHEWAVTTSPLTWPEAAERLALGGGSAGFTVRDFPSASTNTVAGARTTNGEVRVINVSRQSPADTAGVQMGDVVLAINSQPVTAASQIEKAILIRPNAETTMKLQRGNDQKTAALTATNRTSILPGPTLRPELRAKLADATKRLLEDGGSQRPRAIPALQHAPLRGAAENNLGVVFESEDAMGLAIRAYGQAVYADPKVPLYHFNLGLALRKIGSFERALEELETAVRLAPQSMPARKRFAEIHSLLGHDSEAFSLIDAALQSASEDHGAWELKAQFLSKQNRLAEAREAAVKAVELDPDCAVGHGYLAGVLHEQRNLRQAEKSYRKALQLAPFDAVLHMNLGIVQRDLQQLWPAEQSFRKAIELRPDLALAYRNLGTVLSDGNDFASAAAALRKAVELDPNDAGAHRDLGLVDLKQRKFDGAEKSFLNAVDIFPTDAESYYGLGQAHRERRQFAKAELMYRKAIDLKPDYAHARTGLGLVFQARGQFDEAEKFYRKAIELDPKDSAPYHNMGEIYREARGQPDEAEKFYRKALELSPDGAESRSGLGLIAMSRGKLGEAETLFRRARELAPNSSGINNNLGEILRLRGRLEEAEPFYRKALELDPDNIAPYGNLGILLHMRRQFDEAERVFRALLQRSSGNNRLPALVNLASVCGDQGKLEEAEQLLRQALAISPNEPHVCNGLAYFLAEHRLKLDEALTLSRRAVQAAPNDANNLDTLGWVHFQRDELEEAEKTLKKALDLAGQEPPAPEIRQHLKKVQEKKGTTPR